MLKAKLAKTLNLLITLLNFLMQCQRACSKIQRLGREQPIKITLEVQGNYPNFKQNFPGNKTSSSQKSVNASRSLANAVSEQGSRS